MPVSAAGTSSSRTASLRGEAIIAKVAAARVSNSLTRIGLSVDAVLVWLDSPMIRGTRETGHAQTLLGGNDRNDVRLRHRAGGRNRHQSAALRDLPWRLGHADRPEDYSCHLGSGTELSHETVAGFPQRQALDPDQC